MTDINNRVVLITGATGGFGRHMARQFVAAGSQCNQKHIFPDSTARVVHYLQRFFPVLMPILQRRMQSRTIPSQ